MPKSIADSNVNGSVDDAVSDDGKSAITGATSVSHDSGESDNESSEESGDEGGNSPDPDVPAEDADDDLREYFRSSLSGTPFQWIRSGDEHQAANFLKRLEEVLEGEKDMKEKDLPGPITRQSVRSNLPEARPMYELIGKAIANQPRRDKWLHVFQYDEQIQQSEGLWALAVIQNPLPRGEFKLLLRPLSEDRARRLHRPLYHGDDEQQESANTVNEPPASNLTGGEPAPSDVANESAQDA